MWIDLYFSKEVKTVTYILIRRLLRFKGVPVVFRPDFENLGLLPDDASHNPFFSLKHLTQKVYEDSISADSAPTSGGNELIKVETSNAIGFRHRHANLTGLVSFLVIFKCLFTLGFFRICLFTILSKLTFWSFQRDELPRYSTQVQVQVHLLGAY